MLRARSTKERERERQRERDRERERDRDRERERERERETQRTKSQRSCTNPSQLLTNTFRQKVHDDSMPPLPHEYENNTAS